MNKAALNPRGTTASAITAPVTTASPLVTASKRAVSIPIGPKMRHTWTLDERMMCQLMHYAVVKALDIQERMGGTLSVGPRGMRAFSIESMSVSPASPDDEPGRIRLGARGVEVDLYDAVIDTLYAMHAVDPFPVRLIVGIALGVKWARLQRIDLKGRGEKMLGYIRLNALYRMWLASRDRILPMLLEVQPGLTDVIEAEMARARSCGKA